ncbi:MAG TPA: hypothetical protein VF401_02660 [Candidatus Saccharimonadales bacterium]
MEALKAEVFEPVECTAEEVLAELRRQRERDFAKKAEELLPDRPYNGPGPMSLQIGGLGVRAVYQTGEQEDYPTEATQAWLARPHIHQRGHIITLKTQAMIIGEGGCVVEEGGEPVDQAHFWSSQYMEYAEAYKDYSEAQYHHLLNAIGVTLWHIENATTDPMTYAHSVISA